MSSRDVKLATLLRAFAETKDEAEKAQGMKDIEAELVSRAKADRHMRALVHRMTGSKKLFAERPQNIQNHECVKYAVRAYENGPFTAELCDPY